MRSGVAVARSMGFWPTANEMAKTSTHSCLPDPFVQCECGAASHVASCSEEQHSERNSSAAASQPHCCLAGARPQHAFRLVTPHLIAALRSVDQFVSRQRFKSSVCQGLTWTHTAQHDLLHCKTDNCLIREGVFFCIIQMLYTTSAST